MRTLQHILSGETEFCELLKRRQRELALEQCIRARLPPALAGFVHVSDARSEELALEAASGAAAALLRQRSPEVVQALAREGWKFTGIRVRVQVRPAAASTQDRLAKHMDSASARRLLALADELGEAALGHALRRLARHGEVAHSDQKHTLEGVEDEDAQH